MSEASRIFQIVCECCGAKIDVDPNTRSVFYTEKKGMKKKSFKEAVEKATSVGDRAAEKFAAGLQEEKERADKLDKIFEEAQKKAAKEDPNKPPPSIFDYD